MRHLTLLFLFAICACGSERSPLFSTELRPSQSADHYTTEANRYFDALDKSAPPASRPTYAAMVARWEWPPWLYLTGIGKEDMEVLDDAVKYGTPATITRDCRAFDVQPFARCYVTFHYQDGPCPIYEEFTFNDAGEITFIEAWSDAPAFLPFIKAEDPFATTSDVGRLSTRIPGLGRSDGRIDLQGPDMARAASGDPLVADFVTRAENFWPTWFDTLNAAGDDFFARGCGWTD